VIFNKSSLAKGQGHTASSANLQKSPTSKIKHSHSPSIEKVMMSTDQMSKDLSKLSTEDQSTTIRHQNNQSVMFDEERQMNLTELRLMNS